MQTTIQLSEIYTSEAGAVYQCDKRNRVVVQFLGASTVLKVEAFLRLKNAVDSIDLEGMVTCTSRSSDLEIIVVCGCERCFVLNSAELYTLKELLGQALFRMELNSMLQACLSAQVA